MTTDARTLDVPPQRLALVEDELRRLVAHALETRAADIDVEESFSALGVESLVLQSITETLEKTYGPLSPTLLFEYPSIRTLARILVERLPATATAAPVLSPIAVPAPIPPSAPAPIPPPAPRSADSRAIAIVGMNGRFPRSPDVDALWQNLVARRDCIDEIPADRWDHQRYFSADAQPDRTYGKWGGFIDGVDHFDPLFFKISPREAEQMDPQQRLFLECVWATMEHAGHGDPRSYQDRNVGLFVGVMWNEYSRISAEVTQQTGRYSGPGSLYWAIANRVSYWMNFTGPSLAIDTACSSSLVALHQACMAIEHGDCEMAIAGGINLSIDPDKYLYLAQSRFLSTDGRCRSFGDGGSGYVPSEGVGAVLLKPLDQALRDGDHVYGVVRSSAVNHGGRATGFTVPNPEAQARLVGRALTRARISPDAIDYIECHGTGTSLGDPIEIAGLTSAYRKAGVTRPKIAIGSIKSNLGHLEATAGIAGLIKVLLCMQHQALPGNLHSQVKNPSIDFERGLFDVVEDLRPWRAADGAARLAGLSSFGAGGANAHVIIESYEPHVGRGDGVMDGDGEALLLLSARSRDRLVEAAARLRDHLRDRIDGAALGDVAYTLQVGRQHMEHRLAIVASSLDEAR
ncbi:MAG TPA: beta-ketoacyl synthase N-terminal-like domain-containing protein, partial [Kofleriaceae bacterium]|nr:beta-ketoacyl synthase N-terminal-like domain-containing protein [Kofleriaceae bacterium]